jgi:uncharacterized membrane-anchored protein YjiN (DUF445 family)
MSAPMTEYDPDLDARRSLARHRLFASGLLVTMAALTIGSYALPPGYARDLLESAAKAGFVGGIADWFAITALFRRPLGLPIPHTAIIPRQKERLGLALGRFVARHVFTEQEVARILGRLDFAAILHRFLTDPESNRPTAETLVSLLPGMLASMEDGRARRLLSRIVPRLLGGPATGVVIARALRGLVASGRHQEMFGFFVTQFRRLMAGREEAIAAAIEQRVREQGGKLVGWAIGATVAKRVLATLNAELDKMSPDGSELRAAFDEWVRREIDRLEDDPQRAAELGRAIRRVVGNDTVQVWVADLWLRLRLALEADAAKPEGHVVAYLEGALANLGWMLESEPAARARVQRTAERVVARLLPAAQTHLSDFIAKVVAGWDTATITDRLELRVGKDLQFVRVNGTLVGFLAGGLVYAALRATFGTATF